MKTENTLQEAQIGNTNPSRLLLAGMAMQGILSHHGLPSEWNDDNLIEQTESVRNAALLLTDSLIAQENATGLLSLRDEVEQLRLENQLYRDQNEQLCPENNKLRDEIARLLAENENLQNLIAANGINVGKQ